jgi:ubiquinone/menaquinone biosynthesis C-methylase UbiE
VPDAIAANIEVHTRMADSYERNEPHFRPENQQKVKDRLRALRSRVPGARLLDLGCGTGFIIGLAGGLFDEIHGVDITPAMLAKVHGGAGVTLHEAHAEHLPFDDSSFDAATAYSFIDHVSDYAAVLREVARVLAPGGVFYVDLVPNRLFWQALMDVPLAARPTLSDIVDRELSMVLDNDKKVEREFAIPADTFRAAEPGKESGGIDPIEFCEIARGAGFKNCEVTYDWYLGQGAIMHGQSFADSAIIEAYLRRALPLTSHLFKYLYFHAVR